MADKKPPVPARADLFYDDPRRFPLSRHPKHPSDRPSRMPSNIPPYITRRWLHWLRKISDIEIGTEDIIAGAYESQNSIDELVIKELKDLIYALAPVDEYADRVATLEALVWALEAQDILCRTAAERISGTWILERNPSVTVTGDTTLGEEHFGKIIKVNSAGAVNITLQSATAARVDKWQQLVRLGTGSLRVTAAGTDTIGPSSAGGYIVSDETRENPRISLDIPESGKWSFGLPGSYGIWKVY